MPESMCVACCIRCRGITGKCVCQFVVGIRVDNEIRFALLQHCPRCAVVRCETMLRRLNCVGIKYLHCFLQLDKFNITPLSSTCLAECYASKHEHGKVFLSFFFLLNPNKTSKRHSTFFLLSCSCVSCYTKKSCVLSIPMDSFPHKPDVPQYAGAKEKVIVHIIDVANDGLRCAGEGN